jgi:hypothetical protein
MADPLTRREVSFNWSAIPHMGKWGCSDCRKCSRKGHHRKFSRKKAKKEFKAEFVREMQLEI